MSKDSCSCQVDCSELNIFFCNVVTISRHSDDFKLLSMIQ